MEFNEDQPAEENLIKQEISSRAKYFPFFEFSRVIHDAEMPDNIPVDTLVKCTRRISSGKNWEIFFLKKNIGGLHFIFSLAEYDSKIYGVNFKTEEYDYAVIDLPEESQLELEETLQQFIEDTTSLADGLVRFRGWGSPARYTKEDVDACREAILGLPDNSLSREELLHYRGKEIFDLYNEKFDEEFHGSGKMHDFGSRSRARLFRMKAKKILPEWDIFDDRFGELSFTRKSSSGVDTQSPQK